MKFIPWLLSFFLIFLFTIEVMAISFNYNKIGKADCCKQMHKQCSDNTNKKTTKDTDMGMCNCIKLCKRSSLSFISFIPSSNSSKPLEEDKPVSPITIGIISEYIRANWHPPKV